MGRRGRGRRGRWLLIRRRGEGFCYGVYLLRVEIVATDIDSSVYHDL